jgi:hypothetical protein
MLLAGHFRPQGTTIMERTYESAAALAGRCHWSTRKPSTTQVYLDADLELKQRVLDAVTPLNGKPGRYRLTILAFLNNL